jgi:hypothetical protein
MCNYLESRLSTTNYEKEKSMRFTRKDLEKAIDHANAKLRILGTHTQLEIAKSARLGVHVYGVGSDYKISETGEHCLYDLGYGTAKECAAIANEYVVKSI